MNRVLVLLILIGLGDMAVAGGQTTPPPAPEPARPNPEARTTGLPSGFDWKFNFDAGWGTFGFGNSFYNNPKDPGLPENLSDQWFEGYAKPGLTGAYTLSGTSQLYGGLSVVGERTYGTAPELYGPDVSSFSPDDGYIGWRSGNSIGSSENLLDFKLGRAQYRLGHGFLLWDGASEGGSRGGYWTNARKAFQFASIARATPGPHTAEFFFLDKDELPEIDTGTKLWGGNYEFAFTKDANVGASYLRFLANPDVRPDRDGLRVFNIRSYGSPLPGTKNVSYGFEYASERNGDLRKSNAWTIEGGYQFSDRVWEPKISYRYAWFQGDDPATPANEAWDPLLLGFYDWGTWWQGEIAGEYFLSNSNLISHQIRVHATPTEKLAGGLIFYDFRAQQPLVVSQENVIAKQVAYEVDLYADWKANKNVTISIVTAYGDPGAVVYWTSGRTKNFAYLMAYVGYSY